MKNPVTASEAWKMFVNSYFQCVWIHAFLFFCTHSRDWDVFLLLCAEYASSSHYRQSASMKLLSQSTQHIFAPFTRDGEENVLFFHSTFNFAYFFPISSPKQALNDADSLLHIRHISHPIHELSSTVNIKWVRDWKKSPTKKEKRTLQTSMTNNE